MSKRLLDVIVSGSALILLSPLLLLLAALVALDSGFPVFYRQERIGRDFRSFHILKFRSMVAGSQGSAVTVKGDARVTHIGKVLRATKLDELPQLWNVLRGDMSLVGPRPEVFQYVALYRDRYERILEVRPGITDLASVRFRNEEEILAQSANPQQHYVEAVLPAKLNLAEEYVRRHSLALDFRIVLETIGVTLLPELCLSHEQSE